MHLRKSPLSLTMRVPDNEVRSFVTEIVPKTLRDDMLMAWSEPFPTAKSFSTKGANWHIESTPRDKLTTFTVQFTSKMDAISMGQLMAAAIAAGAKSTI